MLSILEQATAALPFAPLADCFAELVTGQTWRFFWQLLLGFHHRCHHSHHRQREQCCRFWNKPWRPYPSRHLLLLTAYPCWNWDRYIGNYCQKLLHLHSNSINKSLTTSLQVHKRLGVKNVLESQLIVLR